MKTKSEKGVYEYREVSLRGLYEIQGGLPIDTSKQGVLLIEAGQVRKESSLKNRNAVSLL